MEKTKIAFFDVSQVDHKSISGLLKNNTSIQADFFEEQLTSQTAIKAADAQVISVFISSNLEENILAALPELKMIASRSTGINHIDLEDAHKRGITVCNVPTYGEHTVAEYTFALLLALSRKILEVVEKTKQGIVDHKGLTGFDLADKTIGIIGTGRIGKQVAKIAKGFGMKVIGYDPYPDKPAAQAIGYEYKELASLLAEADVITLHTPLTKDTKHIINSHSISQTKQGAVIVNTARGELIDTTALIKGLQSAQLSGAALDVLEAENLLAVEEEILLLRPGASKQSLELAAEHSILMKMPNVVLSNHNAYNSREALQRINATTVDNIVSFVSGQPTNVVSQGE